MAKFLFVMWDGGGTVPPELCVARKLIARGHEVRILGDPTIEAEARATGCGFMPWTTAPHRTTRDRSGDLMQDYAIRNPLVAIRKYMGEFLADPAPRWIGDTLKALGTDRADVLVVDFAIPSALIAAEKLRMPAAVLVPNIWVIPTPGIPPLGPGLMPARGPLGRARDAILRGVMTRVFNRALPALNGARREQGLPPVTSTYAQMLRADAVLVLTTPVFDFTSPHMPQNVSYVGPQLDDPHWSEPWRSPWTDGDGRPLVLAGLSSTYQNQTDVLRRITSALAQLPVRGLVTLGQTIPPEDVPASGDVVVVPSAPHTEVLRHASLLITHCGHGTALKGLAAGVPLVCIPMGRDQNDTAARVVARGAGVRLKASASVAAIRAAIEKVLATSSYKESAERLAMAIRSGEGCSDPVEELERLAPIASDLAGAS